MSPDRRKRQKLTTYSPAVDQRPHGPCYFRSPEDSSEFEFFSVSDYSMNIFYSNNLSEQVANSLTNPLNSE